MPERHPVVPSSPGAASAAAVEQDDHGMHRGETSPRKRRDRDLRVYPVVSSPTAASFSAQSARLWCFGRVEARSIAFVGMFFVTLTAASLYSLLAPFFPSVAEAKGVHPGAVGFVFASFSLVVFLSSPAFGVYMAQLGQRNTLFTGLILLSAATVGFGFMERVGTGKVFFTYCIIMRILQGLGSAATETASYAIAATLFPDNVTYMLGILEVANGLGYVVGPPLGGMLYNMNPMLPFLVVGLSPVPVLLSLYHLLPKSLGEGAEHADWGKLRACLARRGVVLVCAAAVIGEGSFAFVEPVLEVYLQPLTAASPLVQTRLGGHHGGVGLIYAVVSVLYSAATPAVGVLSRRDRLGSRNVMVCGLAFIAFGFLLLAPSPLVHWALPLPSLGGVAFGMAFLGLGQSAALVPNMACMMEVCEDMPEQEATTNVLAGILNAAYSLGSMTAPVASSTLSLHLPFKWTTTLWSAMLWLMGSLLYFAWDPSSLLSRALGSGPLMTSGASVGLVPLLRRTGRTASNALGSLASFLANGSAGATLAGASPTLRGMANLPRGRLVLLLLLCGALMVAYYGEYALMSDLNAASSDTDAYYLVAAEAGLKTSSDELGSGGAGLGVSGGAAAVAAAAGAMLRAAGAADALQRGSGAVVSGGNATGLLPAGLQ